MPSPSVALAAVAALLLAVVDWVAVARGSVALERVAKPAVILALLAGVAAAGADPSGLRGLVVVALVGSLAGDVLLLPPGRFVAGLVAFLVAQLAYLARFLAEPTVPAGLALGALFAGLLIVVVGRPILRGAARSGLAAPVAVYLLAIASMAAAAAGTGMLLGAAGAIAFVVSDAILGWDRFVRPLGTRGRVANLATYHIAQVLLVLALAG